jgi:hypothetical protein
MKSKVYDTVMMETKQHLLELTNKTAAATRDKMEVRQNTRRSME